MSASTVPVTPIQTPTARAQRKASRTRLMCTAHRGQGPRITLNSASMVGGRRFSCIPEIMRGAGLPDNLAGRATDRSSPPA